MDTEIWVTLVQGQRMTLLQAHAYFHLFTYIPIHTNFYIIDCNSFWEIHYLGIFPYKSMMNQIWPLCKTVKGQPGVIIWTNVVVLERSMLYTKFQWSWSFGSEEEDF